MKKLACIFFYTMLFIANMQGATRADVKVLEAADGIRYNVSRLTKEYLLLSIYPHKTSVRRSLYERFSALDENMHDIAISTKDPKTKGVLKYFAFEKVRIGEILKRKPTIDYVKELIDFSESFLEGSAAIAKRHDYVPSPEEEMWIVTRSLDQDMEEVIKYYIASERIPDDPELKHKLSNAIAHFKKGLDRIDRYNYSGELLLKRIELDRMWQTLHSYVVKSDKLSLPMITTLMGDDLETVINTLGAFHSKNQ